MSSRLYQIQQATQDRAEAMMAAHPEWPCRKGCADCCRSLAAEPRVSREEWLPMQRAIEALDEERRIEVLRRVRETAGRPRPVVCPLLDSTTDACLIYEARPVACRSYGFYAERHEVLGCHRIEELSRQPLPGVIWGNHAALEREMRDLEGPAKSLSEWLLS